MAKAGRLCILKKEMAPLLQVVTSYSSPELMELTSERPLEVSQEELWRNVDRVGSERNVVMDSDWTSEWVTSRENLLGDLINELRGREHMRPLAPYWLQAVVDSLGSEYSVEYLDEIIRDVKENGVGSSFYNESKIDRDLPMERALKASVG
nr:hypothetical protein, mitochondrial [Tanacetum cinerariifolium]